MPKVAFFDKAADDIRYVRVAFALVLKAFGPEPALVTRSWTILLKNPRAKELGGSQHAVEFKKMGMQTRIIEYFNYQRLYELGEEYLFEVYSSEIANSYLKIAICRTLSNQYQNLLRALT